jgi:DNA-binding GntR family transcriptional regulator
MDLLRIEKPATLKFTARRAIKDLLVTGKLEKDTLYSASTFADILGVSRTPVREALLELTAEGYLIAHDGKGFRVRDVSVKEIRDFFEARKIIELYVIERVVATLPTKVLEQLRGHQRRMQNSFAADDKAAFLDADKAFHLDLIHCHQNHHLISLMNNVRDLISILGHEALVRPGRSQQVLDEHQEVVDAIALHDSAAAVSAMRIHLEATEDSLVAQIRSDSQA